MWMNDHLSPVCVWLYYDDDDDATSHCIRHA